MSGPIVVAGNLSIDDTVNPAGVVDAAPGGDALFAAMGVRAFVRSPVLLTLVGDDYPETHLQRIRAAGIDVTRIRAVAGPTVHYRITNAPTGERRYEWLSDPDRLAATSPELPDYAVLDGAAWLHIAAMPIAAQELAVRAARQAGVPYSLDPHEEYVVQHERLLRSLVRGAAFMPSELEALLLFPDLASMPRLAGAQVAAERLDAWLPSLTVVKVGELGSVVRVRGTTAHVAAAPVEVVDSTGAGDAYCGGFVAGWLATGSPTVAAACGTIAAAGVIGAFGAFPAGPAEPVGERIARAVALSGEDAGLSRSQIRERLMKAAEGAADAATPLTGV